MVCSTLFQAIKGEQPFGDGYIVESEIVGGKYYSDYLLRHGATGQTKVLRAFMEDCGSDMNIDEIYDMLESVSRELTEPHGDRIHASVDGSDYSLVCFDCIVNDNPMPHSAVARMGRDICDSLRLMQQAGLVHHNVKPANICSVNGRYCLASYAQTESLESANERVWMVGTQQFMPPEAFGGKYDLTTDTYSLSMTMYYLLNHCRLPFAGGCDAESARRSVEMRRDGHCLEPLANVTPKLMSIVLRGCAFDPRDRWQSASDMHDALEKYLRSGNSTGGALVWAEALKNETMSDREFSGRWQLIDLLGCGSFGAVYRAEDSRTGRPCAIKVIPVPKNINEIDEKLASGVNREHLVAEYEKRINKSTREALLLAQLSDCPNVVRFYAQNTIYRELGGVFWMSMELLTPVGMELNDERLAARMGVDICKALSRAHSMGILHRDVKPGNILYSPVEGYKLGDFGESNILTLEGNHTITGTKRYMAPELLRIVDVRSRGEYDKTVDIYALGMTLYILLNRGRSPFLPDGVSVPTGDDERHSLTCRMRGDELPDAIHASSGMMRVIRKACAFEPEMRYHSADSMKDALLDLLEG